MNKYGIPTYLAALLINKYLQNTKSTCKAQTIKIILKITSNKFTKHLLLI